MHGGLERLERLLDQVGFLLLGIGVYVLVGQIADHVPLGVQILLLTAVYVPLALLIVALSRAPDTTLAPFRRHGLAAPFFFVCGLWLAAVGWCAGLGLVLDMRGVFEFHTPGGAAVTNSGQIADLLVWHSFEQIPALGVNDTLGWDVPLEYSGGAGLLVLGFKVLILLPLVPVFMAAFRHRRAPAEPPVEAPVAEPVAE
jgi:hypothetical protein